MIITVTSDFGLRDPFVAEMKGVILSLNPGATLVDITHEIAPQDIKEAAFVIGSSFRYFPAGTIHIAVVDPGVGSSRRAIIGESTGHTFVGPDNGIFSDVVEKNRSSKFTQIDAKRFALKEGSATFQGRDLFAPVAARLSLGMRPGDFGVPIDDPVLLGAARPVDNGKSLRGEIIHIDRFGNCIASIKSSDLAGIGCDFDVVCKGRVVRMVRYYEEAAGKELCCVVNSSEFLEFFVNKGNASVVHELRRGDLIDIVRSSRSVAR